MDKDLEKLSALYDGELSSREIKEGLAKMKEDEGLKNTFQKFGLISDKIGIINATIIIKKLDKDLPKDSQILVLSPPPIGEGGIESEEWNLGEKFHEICLESVTNRIGNSDSNRILYRNLYQIAKDDMIRFDCNQKLELSLYTISKSKILSYFMGWKGVRYINGFDYTTDGIHFCEEFGIICKELIIQLLYECNILED